MSDSNLDNRSRLNVFISYARLDRNFADQIDGGLKSKGINVLIDREDIEKWEPWWERIQGLISHADTIIFILSPNWLISKTCKEELIFSEDLSKRLSPIIFNAVEVSEIPESLNKLNFIYYDPKEDFTKWLDEIVKSLLIDIGWIREHTRLGDQARFWDLHGRLNSDLLRDKSLLTAERWLSQKPQEAPPASDMLIVYFKTSREVWEDEERENKNRIERVMISQSQLLAERSRQLTNSGDAVSGILLSLEGLPDKTAGIDRPEVKEAKIACFNALALRREECVFETNAEITNALLTSDGTLLLTKSGAEEFKEINIWDVKTAKLKTTLKGKLSDFSSDGSCIITVDENHSASVWDIKNACRISQLIGHSDTIENIIFDQECSTVATVSKDQTIRIWELKSGKEISVLKRNKDQYKVISFLPGGENILIQGKVINLLSIQSGKIVSTIDTEFENASISMDGKKILTYSEPGFAFHSIVQVWDIKKGQNLFSLEGHESRVSYASFSPDGKKIVTTSLDKTTRIWDAETGKVIKIFEGHNDQVTSASFDKSGKLLVTASYDNSFRVWEVDTGRLVTVLKGHAGDVDKTWSFIFWRPTASFSSHCKKVVTTWKDKTARIWSVEPIGITRILSEQKGKLTGISCHCNGTWFATSSEDKTIIIWDINTGQQVRTFNDITNEVKDVAFSGSGKMLAGVTDDTVYLWNTISGKEIRRIKIKEESTRSVRFSPDETKILVVDNRESLVGIYEIVSGKLITSIESNEWIYSAEYSPNGNLIATTGDERAIRFWDAKTGKELFSVLLGHPSSVYSVSFNQAGTRLIIALDNLYSTIWNIGTDPSKNDSLVQLTGHDKEVLHAAFSPDGKLAVTASADNKIRIYDSESGELYFILTGHADAVLKAIFSLDGEKIISISNDNTIRMWNLFSKTQSLVEYAKKTIPRLLTAEQRKSFYLDSEPPKWYLESAKWPYKENIK